MGHLVAKDLYNRLGEKVDNLHVRAPVNPTFVALLKELYSTEEAEVVVKMPYVLSNLKRIAKITRIQEDRLKKLLDSLCLKGLVMDLFLGGEFRYMPSPLFVGIFEFTMMRTGEGLNTGEWARLFHEYMDEGTPYTANFNKDSKTSIARALPHKEALGEHVEILDYEKTQFLLESAGKYAVGLCSCRHKAEHTGERICDAPLDTCTSLGHGADYMIRNKMAREVSQSEIFDIFERSRDYGLIFSADNVQKGLLFICHCCGCCCGITAGLNTHGLNTTLVTSSFIAQIDEARCNGCGKCVKACHINAIELRPVSHEKEGSKPRKKAVLDRDFCVGCGVCALSCPTGALELVKRKNRVLHPKTTFERVILQCLERNTLQNQLFDNPDSLTHKTMRHIVGGFLALPPVKKTLMSDSLRSTFLWTLGNGVKFLGKGYLHDM